jgi:hypothetical protein
LDVVGLPIKNVGLKLSTWNLSTDTTFADDPDLTPMILVPDANLTVVLADESDKYTLFLL